MFVLQAANHHDVQNFCKLCVDFGFDGIVNKLEDWGTWPSFVSQDVIGNIDHSDHTVAIQNLRQAYAQYADCIQFNSNLADLCQPRK